MSRPLPPETITAVDARITFTPAPELAEWARACLLNVALLCHAGFSQDELELTYQSNLLTIIGKKEEAQQSEYLHRGIAGRPFEHRFELADHVRVIGAGLENGLLSIELIREVPEAMKPRKISIGTENNTSAPKDLAKPKQQEAA